MLTPVCDDDRAEQIFTDKYGDSEPYRHSGLTEVQRSERFSFYNEARKMATTRPDFDVVLTDLLVPASSKQLGPKGEKHVGQEMPLGTVIALRALAVGVKKVAVVTDMNHHDHPASAAFDGFPTFSAGDIRVICSNCDVTTRVDAETFEEVSHKFLQTPEGEEKYPFRDGKWEGLLSAKAWHKVLDRLTGELVEDEEL